MVDEITKQCENYCTYNGCLNTFNGVCEKEKCQTYRLLKVITESEKELRKLQQLKQKNEELKNTINKLGIEHEKYDNLVYWQMKEQQDKLKAENEELKNQIFNWEKINKIQEQKLEQLKEYYKIQLDYCKNRNDCELCILEPCEYKRILQIIEGNNNENTTNK